VPDLINSPKISILGAKSIQLAAELDITSVALDDCDLALFLVSATDGIVSADHERWRHARELYIPSLVIICDLVTSDIDFEDMSAIASKMLDPVVTPFLILHSDTGTPAALINLQTLKVIDYTQKSPVERLADPEHIELVAEFRAEYLEALDDAGEGSFQAGLMFPAIPWIEGTRIGLDQIAPYLNQVPVLG